MSNIELLKKLARSSLPMWHPTTDDLRALHQLGYVQLVHGRRNKSASSAGHFHDSFVQRIMPAGYAAVVASV